MGEGERVIGGPAPTRVLLIEDHRLVREGVKLLLEREPDLAVAGEAADGEAGLRLFARLADEGAVDVVVTDLGLPGIDGLSVARGVKALVPGTPVVLLTMTDADGDLRAWSRWASTATYPSRPSGGTCAPPSARRHTARRPASPRWPAGCWG